MQKSLWIITIIITLSIATALSASEVSHIDSYLLLNNNEIISGRVLVFNNGFLYIKQKEQVLKISPAHMKGIFSNQDRAENAILIFDEPYDFNDASIRMITDTYNFIYNKASQLIQRRTPRSLIISRLSELTDKVKQPDDILDISSYKELLTIAAICKHYELQTELTSFMNQIFIGNTADIQPPASAGKIRFRVKAIEYLINHPYSNKEEKNHE